MDGLKLKVALALHIIYCTLNDNKEGNKKEKVRKTRKTSQKKPKKQVQSQTTQTDPVISHDLPAEIMDESRYEDTQQQQLKELKEQAIEQNQVPDEEVPHISSVFYTADITVVDLLQNFEQVQKHLLINTSIEPKEFITSVIENSLCKLTKHNYHILIEIINLFKDDTLLCQLMFQRVKSRLVMVKAAELDDSIIVADQMYLLLKLLIILLEAQNYDDNDTEEFRIWLKDILQQVDLEHAIIVDLLLKVQRRLEK
ncbi:hypothetical protein MP228_009889 [Amoeboaphelidium protococcarum]|nr:hypothetical protein MP228_009889 [Amoeboaphelidium protococcarum]